MSLVSVIIPTYNRFDELLSCVESVRAQTHEDLEILIIDDHSPDPRYLTLSHHFAHDPRISVIRLEINQRIKYDRYAAQGMTRNVGIEAACGDYLAFLDDDDSWLPDKLAIQLSIFEKHPDCALVASNVWLVRKGKVTGSLFPITTLAPFRRVSCHEIKEMNVFPNSSVLVRSIVRESVGLQRLINCEDFDYWIRILEAEGDGILLEDPLVMYKVDSDKFYEYVYAPRE